MSSTGGKSPEGRDPTGAGTGTSTTNNPPVANPQSLAIYKNLSLSITLTGSDPEGAKLTFSIYTKPQKGSLSGITPNVTYTPNKDYVGTDSFTFRVNDGTAYSDAATIAITVLQGPTGGGGKG